MTIEQVDEGHRGGPIAIDARDLGVRYSLRFTRKTRMRTTFTNLLRPRSGESAFWALREASFRVVQGESLAVIGPNGAGKSTLLQVLAGIIIPSTGVVEVAGHVSSLLTLGAGFDADLSGTDNIRLAGAFLGLPEAEVEDRLPGIVEYADLGPFIDVPLRTYSSGMRARLGFSIATSVEPDILLLDEVLATGDADFRVKSKARVLELVRQARAIVLVTHDMSFASRAADRVVFFQDGEITVNPTPEIAFTQSDNKELNMFIEAVRF